MEASKPEIAGTINQFRIKKTEFGENVSFRHYLFGIGFLMIGVILNKGVL